MTDRPHIIFGTVPESAGDPGAIQELRNPSYERMRILTQHLGLPQDLTGKHVLELFSGDSASSYASEIVAMNGDYLSVDKNEPAGIRHVQEDVYDLVARQPAHSVDYILMAGPLIWGGVVSERDWTQKNMIIFSTTSLVDPEKFMEFLRACTRTIIPNSGNRVSIIGGFSAGDRDEVRRRLPDALPHRLDWNIYAPPTGGETEVRVRREGVQNAQIAKVPEFSFQLIHN